METKQYLKVFTRQNTYKIDAQSEIDQDGSLIKFYVDGILQFAVQTEDFLWCQLLIETPK